jgi:hypothetical protein
MKTQEGPWEIIYGNRLWPDFVNGDPVRAVISAPELTDEFARKCKIAPVGQDFAITDKGDGTYAGFLLLTSRTAGAETVASHWHDYPTYAAALIGACALAVNEGWGN